MKLSIYCKRHNEEISATQILREINCCDSTSSENRRGSEVKHCTLFWLTATGTKFWTQVNLQYCHYVSSQEYKCTNHFSLKRKKSNEGISRKCKSKLLFLRKCQIFIGNWFKFSPRYHCLNQLFSADAEIPSFVLYQLPKLRYDQFWDNFLRSFSGNYSEVKQHRAQSVLGWVTVCSSKKLKNSIFSTFPRYFFF